MPWKKPATSSTARGYGAEHRKLRARWKLLVDAGGVRCWRCSKTIIPGTRWELGHDDWNRSITHGPEHFRCNREAAAAKAKLVKIMRNPRPTTDRW
jgi:hypothetical protein